MTVTLAHRRHVVLGATDPDITGLNAICQESKGPSVTTIIQGTAQESHTVSATAAQLSSMAGNLRGIVGKFKL